jgi:hypothetical protein
MVNIICFLAFDSAMVLAYHPRARRATGASRCCRATRYGPSALWHNAKDETGKGAASIGFCPLAQNFGKEGRIECRA